MWPLRTSLVASPLPALVVWLFFLIPSTVSLFWARGPVHLTLLIPFPVLFDYSHFSPSSIDTSSGKSPSGSSFVPCSCPLLLALHSPCLQTHINLCDCLLGSLSLQLACRFHEGRDKCLCWSLVILSGQVSAEHEVSSQ